MDKLCTFFNEQVVMKRGIKCVKKGLFEEDEYNGYAPMKKQRLSCSKKGDKKRTYLLFKEQRQKLIQANETEMDSRVFTR